MEQLPLSVRQLCIFTVVGKRHRSSPARSARRICSVATNSSAMITVDQSFSKWTDQLIPSAFQQIVRCVPRSQNGRPLNCCWAVVHKVSSDHVCQLRNSFFASSDNPVGMPGSIGQRAISASTSPLRAGSRRCVIALRMHVCPKVRSRSCSSSSSSDSLTSYILCALKANEASWRNENHSPAP